MTWRECVRTHRRTLLAVDFFTVETIWLQWLYVLFFIELGSRRLHLAGRTLTPTAEWVTQQARQLTWSVSDRPDLFRYLIRDRDQKFTDGFDEVFRSAGCEIIRTPFRAPQANGVAERFVRTVRSGCFDRLLMVNEQHLKHVLTDFVAHYNGHRPHRVLGLKPPLPMRSTLAPVANEDEIRVERRDRLGTGSRVRPSSLTAFLHPTRVTQSIRSAFLQRSTNSPLTGARSPEGPTRVGGASASAGGRVR